MSMNQIMRKENLSGRSANLHIYPGENSGYNYPDIVKQAP